MAATMTMQGVEKQVRENHLLDLDSSAYRWTPKTVLVFIFDSIKDLCETNPWAKYDQDTGDLLADFNVPQAEALAVMEAGTSLDNQVAYVRTLTIPVDNRFKQAIVAGAAARCLSIDNSDTANAQKAAELFDIARRSAFL